METPSYNDHPLFWLSHQDPFLVRHAYENILITGSTGSGKTSGSGAEVALSMMAAQFSFIVFLFKQNETDQWYRWAEETERLADIIHITAEHENVYNLLEPYQHQEPMNGVYLLETISEMLMESSNKGEEVFWKQMQRQALDRAIRLCQLADEPLSPITLFEIHTSAPAYPEQANPDTAEGAEFLANSRCAQLIAQAFQKHGNENPQVKLVYNYYLKQLPNLADRTRSSVDAMVSGTLEPFVSSELLKRLFCGTSTLKLSDVFSGKIVLLDIPVQTKFEAGRIAQLLLKYTFQRASEQRDLREYPHPVVFWQDEAQAFITKHDSGFLSTCRSSRVCNVFMSQNISNFHAAMGGGSGAEARTNSLLALCNLKIFHANNDHVTNEYAAKTIGMAPRSMGGASIGPEKNTTTSTSEQMHHQVEPVQFTMLKGGGPDNNMMVDSIICGTARRFAATGKNYLSRIFIQQ